MLQIMLIGSRVFAQTPVPADASALCDIFLIPKASRAFVRMIERSDRSSDVAKQVADAIVRTFATDRDAEIAFETEPSKYSLKFNIEREGRTVRIEVHRTLSFRKIYGIKQRSLRSPLVDVWAGLSLALIEIARRDPTIEEIQVQGMYMHNRKFRSLIRRRFGFGRTGLSSPRVSLRRVGTRGAVNLRERLGRLFGFAR